MKLHLPVRLIREAVRHAAQELPREACGAIVLPWREAEDGETGCVCARSTASSPAAGRGARYVPLRNAHPEPERRFAADAGEWVALIAGLRARGERLLALVHSHPSAPAVPSAEDQATPWRCVPFHLIVSLADPDSPVVRAWKYEASPRTGPKGGCREVPIVADE